GTLREKTAWRHLWGESTACHGDTKYNSGASTGIICFFQELGEQLNMAKNHSPRFLQLVKDRNQRVGETIVGEIKKRLDRGDKFALIDVREESEWAKGHLPNAIHLGKGILERDVEEKFPDPATELVLYCGGGYRSALAAENLQKMGYTNVTSM